MLTYLVIIVLLDKICKQVAASLNVIFNSKLLENSLI